MASSLKVCIALAIASLASANPLPRDDSPAQCPKKIVTAAPWTFGPTQTIWTETATATHLVDCGACEDMTVSQLFMGHGPVVIFTTSTTAVGPSMTTELRCSPTAGSGKQPAVTAAPAKN